MKMKNKKGMAQFAIFAIIVIAIILFMFSAGSISGFLAKKTLSAIPWWVWAIIIFAILASLGGKRKK